MQTTADTFNELPRTWQTKIQSLHRENARMRIEGKALRAELSAARAELAATR